MLLTLAKIAIVIDIIGSAILAWRIAQDEADKTKGRLAMFFVAFATMALWGAFSIFMLYLFLSFIGSLFS